MRDTIDGGIERRHIPIEGLPSSMTAGKVLVLIATTLALVLVMSGCSGSAAKLQECRASAGAASNGCLYASLKVQLETSIDVYSEALRAAGRAHSAGLLTDAQLEQVRTAGKAAEKALKAARAALAGAVEAQESGTVLTAFGDAQRAIAELTSLIGGSR